MIRHLIILLAASIVVAPRCHGQFMTEDSKGNSTILYKGSTVNFDLSETALSLNWNNLKNMGIEKPNTLILGASAYGKNEEGLTALLSDGDFVPSTRVNGIIGIKNKTFSKAYRRELALTRRLEEIDKDETYRHYQLLTDFMHTAEELIRKSTFESRKKDSLEKIIKKAVFENSGDVTALDNEIKALSLGFQKTGRPDMAAFLDSYSVKINHDNVEFINRPDGIRNLEDEVVKTQDAIAVIRAGSCNRNLIFFVNGGTESKKFFLFSPEAVTDLNDHFKKKVYRTDYVDVVFNYHWCGPWIFGASVGYQRYDTFDSLSKKDYTVRRTVTQGDQQLITEKKYEGYGGVFKQYDRLNIKTDLLYFAKAGEKKDYRVIWNVLYSRWYLSDNKEVAKRVVNIGTGLNFFKVDGKFVGGFYLEERDLFNGNGVSDSDFWNRVSFGLVGKYSFQTILDRN